jgi:hypothetical protein
MNCINQICCTLKKIFSLLTTCLQQGIEKDPVPLMVPLCISLCSICLIIQFVDYPWTFLPLLILCWIYWRFVMSHVVIVCVTCTWKPSFISFPTVLFCDCTSLFNGGLHNLQSLEWCSELEEKVNTDHCHHPSHYKMLLLYIYNCQNLCMWVQNKIIFHYVLQLIIHPPPSIDPYNEGYTL